MNEMLITILFHQVNQNQIPLNENPILLKQQKRKERQEDEHKLYSRATTLTSYDEEEEESGLLVLWIVLGVVGLMFGFIIISYVINYILYNRRNRLIETTEREHTFTTTMNPMPLGIINFGHNNQQNLSKEDLDKCPVFRFKNKKHQYKNSNGK